MTEEGTAIIRLPHQYPAFSTGSEADEFAHSHPRHRLVQGSGEYGVLFDGFGAGIGSLRMGNQGAIPGKFPQIDAGRGSQDGTPGGGVNRLDTGFLAQEQFLHIGSVLFGQIFGEESQRHHYGVVRGCALEGSENFLCCLRCAQ